MDLVCMLCAMSHINEPHYLFIWLNINDIIYVQKPLDKKALIPV